MKLPFLRRFSANDALAYGLIFGGLLALYAFIIVLCS